MRIIALLPVRNEAWVLPHSLACLSAFCDVVLVNDQRSDDRSREICREFPKVVLLESPVAQICEQARWTLWDAARDYDGANLIWCTDADELVSPKAVQRFVAAHGERLTAGTMIDCQYYHVWEAAARYRNTPWPYGPYAKPIAVVDDRRIDYGRSRSLPLHEERVPIADGAARLAADDVSVLHLQWLLPARNQMRQAWYRCREWIHGERSVRAINETYACTLPRTKVPTAPVPQQWIEDVTFPDLAIDAEVTWQEREILGWFAERGPESFEPLEIWHVDVLREAFVRAVGRRPRSDRSHYPSLPARAAAATTTMARRVAGAARRRMVSGLW